MNPFREGSKSAKAFETLRDLRWHCGKHELPGTQSAGLVKRIAELGYETDKKTAYCHTCREETTHRRLTSLDANHIPEASQAYLDGL